MAAPRAHLALPVTEIAVLVPCLMRPHRVQLLIDSLRAADEPGIETRPVFICSAGDRTEIVACEKAGVSYLTLTKPGRSEFARKINLGIASSHEEWVFVGADDIYFHPGWAREALAVYEETGCLFIGTNDLGNPAVKAGRHATHFLVHRDYIALGTVDDRTKFLCELYDHNSVDVEAVETAKARGAFAFAEKSHVEHLHRLWGKATYDQTYRKGMRNALADRRLCERRRRLWLREPGARGRAALG